MNDYKKPEVKGAKTTLRVVCIPDSFRRAGRRWSGITDVLASEFTQEQLDAIMNEPNLYSHWLIDIDAPISPNPSSVSDTSTELNQSSQEVHSFHDTKPAYIDENHPMFSRELFIAIEAWEKVLSSNPESPSTGSRKKLITEWLAKNYKELSGEATERIAVMLNPDKNGGAPKTP